MKFWIFKCNKDYYRLDERLAVAPASPRIRWRVTNREMRQEISEGDLVFIYETGKHRAIRATMRISVAPREMDDLPGEEQYSTVDGDAGPWWMVEGVLQDYEVRVPMSALRDEPGLERLSILDPAVFQMATNFRVTPDQGRIILRQIARSGTRPASS